MQKPCKNCRNVLSDTNFPRILDSLGQVSGYGATCLLCINDLRRKPNDYWPLKVNGRLSPEAKTAKQYDQFNLAQIYGKTWLQKRRIKRIEAETKRAAERAEILRPDDAKDTPTNTTPPACKGAYRDVHGTGDKRVRIGAGNATGRWV